MRSTDEALGQQLARQRGLCTRQQALALGLSADALAGRVRSGRWRRLERGIYLAEGAPFDWATRLLAGCLRVEGVATARSAGALFRLPGCDRDSRPQVLVGHGSSPTTELVDVVRTRGWDELKRQRVDGIPTLGLLDTVLSLAVDFPPAALVDVVDAVVRDHSMNIVRLEMAADQRRYARGGGVQLLAALADRRGDQVVPLSSWTRRVQRSLVEHGLDRPEAEYRVVDDGRFVAQVDLAYPDARLAIELDSRAWHLNSRSFESDPQRRNRLAAIGWQTLTLTWDRCERFPAEVAHEVALTLRQRRSATAQDPAAS